MGKLAEVARVLATDKPEAADLVAAIAAFGNLTTTLQRIADDTRAQVDSLAKRQGEALAKLAKTLFEQLTALESRVAALEAKPFPVTDLSSVTSEIEAVRRAVGSLPRPSPPTDLSTVRSDVAGVLSALKSIRVEKPKTEYRFEIHYDSFGDPDYVIAKAL